MLLSFQCCGIGNYFSYNNDLIDLFLLVYKLLSCIHYLGGIIPYLARNMAIVYPSLFYNNGLWFHSFGGIILYLANNIATVYFVFLD